MPRQLSTRRLSHVAGSLAIVLAAYWAYAWVAVPLIDPSADLQQDRQILGQDRQPGTSRSGPKLNELADLFPPDAWELDRPKVLKNDRMTLMFDQYRNIGGSPEEGFQVELSPLTVIFAPDEPADETADDEIQRRRQSIVLQVPEGALLTFDEPFDLRHMKIGRLVGGKLKGRVIIRSQGKLPGPEDDLLVVTHDVQMNQQQVWTQAAVEFRWGAHYGWGRGMVIRLASNVGTEEDVKRGPNIGGIESFELSHVERLHLDLGQMEKDETAVLATRPEKDSRPLFGAGLPVEITCRGPFRFSLVDKVATFEDRVDVIRINPDGPSDQLHCELLSVFFADRVRPGPNSKKSRGFSMDIEPQWIEARADPVVVSAPSEQLEARGRRLEYHLKRNRIVLDGNDPAVDRPGMDLAAMGTDYPVMLRRGSSEIHARSLEYESAGPGRMGRIMAEGPGWLRGQMDERPDQKLEAHWGGLLQVRPHEENQVISLTGGARLEYPDVGRLKSPEIHFYLLEIPIDGEPERYRIQPDRLLACQGNRQHQAHGHGEEATREEAATSGQNIVIESPQLSSVIEERLEVWFEQAATAEGENRQADTRPIASRQSPAAVQPSSQPSAGRQHFQVVGRLLRARVVVRDGEDAELSELTVEGGVEFVESRTAQPDELPLVVLGDWLHVVDADKPHAAVTVTGKPASFRGRGLSLAAQNISLNRGTNRLWVDGPGRMELPLKNDLDGQPLSSPGVLVLLWQRQMEFDGRTARFEEAVTASTVHGYLQTETLEARFTQAIDFSRDKLPKYMKPEIEQLLCGGNVFMENRDFDGPTQISHEQMQMANLTVNLLSGVLEADGPGSLISVRRGSGDLLGSGAGTSAGENGNHTPTPGRRDDRLMGLHVRFHDRIVGNVIDRQMTFHGQVQTAYAAVDSWEATLDVDRPETLGPGGAVMQCGRLRVSELNAPTGATRELEALDNVFIEGNSDDGTFAVRAVRVTYDQAKDLLVLEGDGRTDARLFRQQRPGGPLSEFAARKIRYWPLTNKWLKVDGARFLQSRLPAGDQGNR